MNTMTMPGFSAEASLYKTSTRYSMNTRKLIRAEVNIFPQIWQWPREGRNFRYLAQARFNTVRSPGSTRGTRDPGSRGGGTTLRIKGTGKVGGNPALDSLCGQMADLINEAFDNADQNAAEGRTDEAALDREAGLDMLAAGVQRGTCTFS